MREIKFRAWDEKHNEMRYSDKHDGEFHINTRGVLYMYKIPSSNTGKEEVDYYKTYNVMQFTGLKDKNGEEVYEGDYIMIYFEDGRSYGEGVIKFHKGGFQCNDMHLQDIHCESLVFEKIGNIYENKELLETK